MDSADLRRIEDILENIYEKISDRRSTSADVDTDTDEGEVKPKSGKNLGTGIYQIDKYIHSMNRTQKNVEEFGEMLSSTGNEKLKGFGSNLSKYSGYVAAGLNILQGAIELWKGIVAVKNIKNAASAQAARRDIQENQLQFQRDTQLHGLETEEIVAGIGVIGDVALKDLETEGSIMLQSLKIMADNQIKATEIAVGPLIDGINETAYKAAQYNLERKKEYRMLDIEKEKAYGEKDLYIKLREEQYKMQMGLISRQKETARASYEAESMINARDKAIEVREAESEAALRELMYNTTVGALVGSGSGAAAGAAVGSAGGPVGMGGGAMIGGISGFVVGGANGIYRGINDDTGNEAYNRGHSYTNGMKNVFNKNGYFDEAARNYQADPHMMGKWERKMFKEFTDNRKETEWITSIDKMAADMKMQAQGAQTITENTNKILNEKLQKQTDLQMAQLKITTEAKKIMPEKEIGEETNWLKLAEHTEKWLDNFDKVTNNLGKSLGFTNRGQLDDFQQSMFVAAQAAAKFGKSFEEAVKIQQSFSENTGRNRMFSEEDYLNSLRLGEYLGDNGLAASYASEMEIFNVGVSDSVDMLGEALEDVNRMGLNGRKYTKTLVDNLKLAQKYNFKDGTKGLMRMAKWAENTRFNMASLSGMLDKVREGGLEGIITQGAQFQVLGGHAAMNADPIAMMYEAFADPEALMKRYQDMTKGYGQIDKETGETKFSGNEVMMMQQIAKIQGRSLEDVQNEVRARNKKEVVAKQLRGDFDEEQQSFISNNATYDKETGQFKVKVKQGNQYVDKDVNQLTEEDLENIMPADYQGHMLKNMDTLVDYAGQLVGKTESANAKIGEADWETRKENYEKRMETFDRLFDEKFPDYVEKSQEYMEFITNSYGGYVDLFKNSSEEVTKEVEQIEKMTEKIASSLSETAEVIQDANNFIKESIKNLENSNATYGGDGYSGGGSGGGVRADNDEKYDKFKKVEKNIKAATTTLNPIENIRTSASDIYKNVSKGDWRGVAKSIIETSTPFTRFFLEDGIISGKNNKPIVAQADKVTKIHDGFVQSDPKDVAIFAKEGGTIGESFAKVANDVHDLKSGETNVIRIELNGNLTLSSNGQSMNVIDVLNRDEVAKRELVRLVVQQISSDKNGGKGRTNISIGNSYNI